MKAHLSVDHLIRFLQILPPCIHDIDGRFFAPLNTIRLDERRTIQQQIVGNTVQRHAWFHAQIHVRRTQIVHVKPNIFRESVFDQIFIFVLVLLGCWVVNNDVGESKI